LKPFRRVTLPGMQLSGVLLALSILPLIVATALLILGLRGRRIDDHPLCRRCGFDLVGLPRTSTVCSECGTDLSAKRAIRTGHRVRRGPMMAMSIALLIPSLLWIGIVGYAAAGGADWMSCKPVWLLLRDAQSDNASMAEFPEPVSEGEADTVEDRRRRRTRADHAGRSRHGLGWRLG
jgi:hypothetical protein